MPAEGYPREINMSHHQVTKMALCVIMMTLRWKEDDI